MIRGLLVLLILMQTACDESVEVVLGTEKAFTVYGHLSAHRDTQAVRVYAIDQTIDVVRPDRLDARVESSNLQTGQGYTWRDSIIQFDENHFGHVFWATFRPKYDEIHQLKITRTDGATSSVELQIPPESIPKLTDPIIRADFVHLPILWQHAPRLNNIRVQYHTNKGVYSFKYGNEQQQVESGQLAQILVYRDVREVFREIFRTHGATADARLQAIEQTALVSNPEWVPPGNTFSPEVLIEPGIFSNVENGFGFVGAGYEASFYYEVPDSVALAAGFAIR